MTDSGYFSQSLRSRSASGESKSSLETSVSASSCSCDGCSDEERVPQQEDFFRTKEELHNDEDWVVVDINNIF